MFLYVESRNAEAAQWKCHHVGNPLKDSTLADCWVCWSCLSAKCRMKKRNVQRRESENSTYQFHTEGAVVDGLILDVDVHQGTGLGAFVAGAESGRHECLVAHGCRWWATRPVWNTETQEQFSWATGRLLDWFLGPGCYTLVRSSMCVCVCWEIRSW